MMTFNLNFLRHFKKKEKFTLSTCNTLVMAPKNAHNMLSLTVLIASKHPLFMIESEPFGLVVIIRL